MTNEVGVQASLKIDESKITIITRAQRLSGIAVKHLQARLKDAESIQDAPQIIEAIAWLQEMGA